MIVRSKSEIARSPRIGWKIAYHEAYALNRISVSPKKCFRIFLHSKPTIFGTSIFILIEFPTGFFCQKKNGLIIEYPHRFKVNQRQSCLTLLQTEYKLRIAGPCSWRSTQTCFFASEVLLFGELFILGTSFRDPFADLFGKMLTKRESQSEARSRPLGHLWHDSEMWRVRT